MMDGSGVHPYPVSEKAFSYFLGEEKGSFFGPAHSIRKLPSLFALGV
jgi:hypothetical protein